MPLLPAKKILICLPGLFLASYLFAAEEKEEQDKKEDRAALEIIRKHFSLNQEIPSLESEAVAALAKDAEAARKKNPDESLDDYAARVYAVAERIKWDAREAYRVYVRDLDLDGILGLPVAGEEKKPGAKESKKDAAIKKAARKKSMDIARRGGDLLKQAPPDAALPPGGGTHEHAHGALLENALAQNKLPHANHKKLLTKEPPAGAHTHHALGDNKIAPAPGILDRIGSAMFRDGATVAQDLRSARTIAAELELPRGYTGHNSLAASRPPEFLRWLQTAEGKDLPSMGYGILPEGTVGSYEPGLLSKGEITMNYHIRNEDPSARGAVMLHELYHYWDKKVARNHYTNVSYGKIDPANMWRHEVDATMLAALAAQQSLAETCMTALCNFLGSLPTDIEEVAERVRGAYR